MRTRQTSKAGFTSILCAVDFSLQSEAALQTAIQIARAHGAMLTALCVEDPLTSAGAAASGYDTAALRKATLAQLGRLVERVATTEGLGRNAWTVETLPGRPARAILACARRMAADLVVMGTNGRSGPAKFFFGSVADEVLRHTSVPILVVPRSGRRRAAQLIRNRPLIGAIELQHSRVDARRMARVARMLGGELTLVHVVNRDGDVPTVDYYQRDMTAAEKRLQAVAKSVGAQCCVLLGKPEDEIVVAAAAAKAGIIVLALRRGRGVFGRRQGATTYRVLCSSAIPVLALPARRFTG
jgi:nucleotide-binding universal stress UspA family protein